MLPNLVESKGLEFDRLTPANKAVFTDESAVLTVHQNIVTVNPAASALTVTLPPVGDCAGRVFAITVNAGSAGGTVTIKDSGDSIQWANIVVGAEKDGGALLYCDGARFWPLFSKIV